MLKKSRRSVGVPGTIGTGKYHNRLTPLLSSPPLPEGERGDAQKLIVHRRSEHEVDAFGALVSEESGKRKIVVMNEAMERRRAFPVCVLAKAPRSSPPRIPHPPAKEAEVLHDRARSPSGPSDSTDCVQRLMTLIDKGEHVKAFFAISVQLSEAQQSDRDVALLYGLRGRCHYKLMNFKESTEDLNRFFQAIRLFDEPQSQEMRAWIFLLLDSLVKALTIVEDYEGAARVASWMLEKMTGALFPSSSSLAVLRLTDVEVLTVEQYLCAIPVVREFRLCVQEERWTDAARTAEQIRSFLADTPLVVLLAAVLLETGAAQKAREALLPYLPGIPPPPCGELDEDEEGAGKEEEGRERQRPSPEEYQLRSNIIPHYLLANVLLAKASIYCGRLYINIAAVLVQRCLRVDPLYTPAITVGNYLVALESCFDRALDARTAGDWGRAERAVTEGLQLDTANARICAVLYLERAEIRLEAGQWGAALSDCTSCLELDSRFARAYVARAEAYGHLGMASFAEADRATAREINPIYGDLFDEQEMRKRNAPEADARRRESGRSKGSRRPFSGPRCDDNACGSASAGCIETLYDILAVSSRASPQEIRKSFRQLTLRYHPDKVVGESNERKLFCLEQFKKINHAYSILSDASKRSAYDFTLFTAT